MCLGFKIKTDIVFAIILIAKLGISKKETGKASGGRKYLLMCLSSCKPVNTAVWPGPVAAQLLSHTVTSLHAANATQGKDKKVVEKQQWF